ncbi:MULTISPECIES: hypothetical protein [unclassified Streptomyces]|uniref:hypothetical protein n=1 Tax=unclassified Streptomyces TaxID=2593676 RepID=UPI0036682B8B
MQRAWSGEVIVPDGPGARVTSASSPQRMPYVPSSAASTGVAASDSTAASSRRRNRVDRPSTAAANTSGATGGSEGAAPGR